MHVQVLSHMPFAGKQRKPGDSISEADWLKATDAVRSALIGQGLVRISDGARGSNAGPAAAALGGGDAIELLQDISAKLDRLLEGGAKKAKKTAKAKK